MAKISDYPVVAYGNCRVIKTSHLHEIRTLTIRSSGAVRVIKQPLDPSAHLQSLIREARALQSLNGAFAPREVILGGGDGFPLHLSMEYVDGPDLRSLLKGHDFPAWRIDLLMRNLILSLKLMHADGVAHLDLAPDNILVRNEDVRQPVFIDFGCCAFAEEMPFPQPRGCFTGHWGYAAPEQFGLAGGQVGFASDIYSLGLVLREMAGATPLNRDSLQSLLACHRRSPDLSEVAAPWRAVIEAMLAYHPEDRRLPEVECL